MHVRRGSIFSHVGVEDLGAAARVCRRWNDVVTSEAVAGLHYARVWGIDSGVVRPSAHVPLNRRLALIASTYAGPSSLKQWWETALHTKPGA